MWFTPYRSSNSSARSASAWLTRARAAAPKRVTLLRCPVRPNGRRSIMSAPSLQEDFPQPGHQRRIEPEETGHHLLDLLAADGIDVEPGFLGFGEKLGVL